MRSDREKNKFPWFDETRPLADRIEEAWSALYVALTNPRISRIYMAANGKVKEQHRIQCRKRWEQRRENKKNADYHPRTAGIR